jgi:hypothetical protein
MKTCPLEVRIATKCDDETSSEIVYVDAKYVVDDAHGFRFMPATPRDAIKLNYALANDVTVSIAFSPDDVMKQHKLKPKKSRARKRSST